MKQEKKEAVNHPSHYNDYDVYEQWDGTLHYNACCVSGAVKLQNS